MSTITEIDLTLNPEGIEHDLHKSAAISPSVRFWMGLVIATSDFLTLSLAGLIAFETAKFLGKHIKAVDMIPLLPFLFFFIFFYASKNLYPPIGLSQAEELKRLTISTSTIFLLLTAYLFLTKGSETYSRGYFLLNWIFALGLVPLGRVWVRAIFIKGHVWGEPVVIFGYGKQSQRLLESLNRNPNLGFVPKMVIGFERDPLYPVAGTSYVFVEKNEKAVDLLRQMARGTVFIDPDVPRELFQRLCMDQSSFGQLHIIMVTSIDRVTSVDVKPYDLGGILGLEVSQNLLGSYQQIIKRGIDIALVIVGGFVLWPVFVLLALMIRFDSPGPIFFRHTRVGKCGKPLKAWKFRTMVDNADQVLAKFLESNPALREEWENTRKLKRDPRVTKVGRFLRNLSLDELPQVINVVKGEMSLVGPRPIVGDEVIQYGDGFDFIQQVTPGITGLWQVSGRSNTTYQQRVSFDEYYVRNWSIWLDIYILIKTVQVVFFRQGAY